jgi:Tfp pilus assembly protein PilF
MSAIDPNQLLQAGSECQQRGDLAAAEKLYRQVIDAFPHHAGAYNAYGALAMQVNQPEHAARFFRNAIAIDSANGEYFLNLGSALRSLRQLDDALAAARQAVNLAPDIPGPYTLLAAVLMDLNQPEEALEQASRAVQIDPQFFQAHHALTWIYGRLLRPRDVIASADRALALGINHPGLRWNKALAALTLGDFETGWAEFEWRLPLFPHLRRDFAPPQWNRQDLAGKTILLHCEGGFGDAIQFVRFAPIVARQAGRTLLECQPELFNLFSTLPGVPTLIRRGDALPAFDYHCPLQSLPYNLHTTLQTIPADIPYLSADAAKVERFRSRMLNPRLSVGLVWAGSPLPNDFRSRTLSTFAPLAAVPGVKFFSLQKGPDAAQAAHPPAGMDLHDLSADLNDFSDTAAAIANLDLFIGVDTSIGHVAGALGKPVWTLLPFVEDFRWMLHRPDTPWYPTMRLYRQTDRTNWDEPIARMAADLSGLSRRRSDIR